MRSKSTTFSGISVKQRYSFYYLSQYVRPITKGKGHRRSGEWPNSKPGLSFADVTGHLSGLGLPDVYAMKEVLARCELVNPWLLKSGGI